MACLFALVTFLFYKCISCPRSRFVSDATAVLFFSHTISVDTLVEFVYILWRSKSIQDVDNHYSPRLPILQCLFPTIPLSPFSNNHLNKLVSLLDLSLCDSCFHCVGRVLNSPNPPSSYILSSGFLPPLHHSKRVCIFLTTFSLLTCFAHGILSILR